MSAQGRLRAALLSLGEFAMYDEKMRAAREEVFDAASGARAEVATLFTDLTERTAERDALAATVERLIREAGAIRLDERRRAKAEHEALEDAGRQRDANRIERLEGELARLRVIVDDADKAKAEHAATRDELKRLHDVLSGAKK